MFIFVCATGDIYPCTEVLLRLFNTLPIGISSAERSFSVLRRLKTHLRSTMTTDRSSDLAFLSIESDVADDIQLDEFVDVFIAHKWRRDIWML